MWMPYDNGLTLGTTSGSERGIIIRDEEHTGGGRITLERDTARVPFAITCGIYGAMVHTRFFGEAGDAVAAYKKMKQSLDHIIGCENGLFIQMIEEFIRLYP